MPLISNFGSSKADTRANKSSTSFAVSASMIIGSGSSFDCPQEISMVHEIHKPIISL
jgi:hypothetical protein